MKRALLLLFSVYTLTSAAAVPEPRAEYSDDARGGKHRTPAAEKQFTRVKI